MSEKQSSGMADKLVEGYNTMLNRLQQAISQAKEAKPALQHGIDAAMEKATELEELSREEAEKIGDYLKKDLHDAATFLNRSGKELKDWLNFDMEVVERELGKRFSEMVDHTRLELDKLEQMANQMGEWHTGEITGIGTLECKSCGELLHFHHTAHIPPCPRCRGTKYRRLSKNDE